MSFERACALADIPEDEGVAVTLGGQDVVVARCQGEDGQPQVFALEDVCSHESVPLSDGMVEGCEIECFLHGSMFDLRTGKPTGLPATVPVSTFPVEVRDGDVYVDTATTLNGVPPNN